MGKLSYSPSLPENFYVKFPGFKILPQFVRGQCQGGCAKHTCHLNIAHHGLWISAFERREDAAFKKLDSEDGENINFGVDAVAKFCGSKQMDHLFLRESGK